MNRGKLEDYPDVMNVADVSKILGVGMNTTYELLRKKKLISLKIGRAYKIPKAALLYFLNKDLLHRRIGE